MVQNKQRNREELIEAGYIKVGDGEFDVGCNCTPGFTDHSDHRYASEIYEHPDTKDKVEVESRTGREFYYYNASAYEELRMKTTTGWTF